MQVVMDSAASFVAAGNLVTEKYPGIVSSPCSAHCLDLLLEDIGKLHWVGAVIDQGKEVVKVSDKSSTSTGLLSVTRKSRIIETR